MVFGGGQGGASRVRQLPRPTRAGFPLQHLLARVSSAARPVPVQIVSGVGSPRRTRFGGSGDRSKLSTPRVSSFDLGFGPDRPSPDPEAWQCVALEHECHPRRVHAKCSAARVQRRVSCNRSGFYECKRGCWYETNGRSSWHCSNAMWSRTRISHSLENSSPPLPQAVAGWKAARCDMWARQRARTGHWLGDAELKRVIQSVGRAK